MLPSVYLHGLFDLIANEQPMCQIEGIVEISTYYLLCAIAHDLTWSCHPLVEYVISCHSRHPLLIHYRNLGSHQLSFHPFPISLLYWICCISWPSKSIPTPLPIYNAIVAPTHCDEPILDDIFPSEVVDSWTRESVTQTPHSSIPCSCHFFHTRHSYGITSQITGAK